MKVSLNTLKQYTEVNLSVEELVLKINLQLGKVENVVDLGERYRGAVIVRVVECVPHPNADRLHVCKVDDGGEVNGAERDDAGLVRVVCGAPNVRAGMFAVWLPPGATVPASYDEKEPFVLDARELRGVVSNGMLASAKELALGDSHEGILEIDPNEWKHSDIAIEPGMAFAGAYGLDDIIIDVENKMFTHRPDCFGQLGVAREVAGIQHRSFTSPAWYTSLSDFQSGDGLDLSVKNEAVDAVPRFMAVALSNIAVKPSPIWLQSELTRLGGKPINNIVDATNYVMLLTGQPTHAYDYDKLGGSTLGVRRARNKETITLLNRKTYTLTADDIVIVDGNGPVGLAGIMGGGDSEVSDNTANIVIECATFDMYAVRKSSMRHGVFTDALTRFNKGQSPLQNAPILSFLTDLILKIAGGEVASHVFDDSLPLKGHEPVKVTASFINARLGLELLVEDYAALLTNVEFDVKCQKDLLTVAPPFWRTDIVLPEDIVEEAGRLYGFDRLPRVLPGRSAKPVAKNESREIMQYIRESLSRSGANEVLTYSFVHENVLKNSGQDAAHAYRLANALSPDLQYYRLSLVPSLLDKVHMNIKAGHDRFALFELNKVHYKGEMDPDEPAVPKEDGHAALVLAYNDKQKPAGAPYYYARNYLNRILDMSGEALVQLAGFDLSRDEWGAQLTAPYEPARSAVIVRDGEILGVVGEFKTSVRRAWKLPDFTAGFEVHLDVLKKRQPTYRPLPRYPKVSQDISLKVPANTAFSDVYALADQTVRAAEVSSGYALVEPQAIYQPDGSDMKTITLHIEVASQTGTLKDTELSAVLDALAERAAEMFRAERV